MRLIHENCLDLTTTMHIRNEKYYFHFLVLAVVLFIMGVITIIFNVLTILTLVYAKKLKTISNILLFCLATTDLMAGLTSQPMLGVIFLQKYFKIVSCRIFLPTVVLLFIFATLTTVTVALISMDKYYAILYPLRYSVAFGMDQIHAKRILLVIWVTIILIGTFSLFTDKLSLIRQFMMTVCCASAPLSIFVHLRVLFVIRKQRRQIHARAHRLSVAQHTGSQHIRPLPAQGLRISMTIAVTMFLCYLPIMVMSAMLRSTYLINDVFVILFLWCNAILLLNSLLNPLIFCWQLRGFRRDLLNLVGRCRVYLQCAQNSHGTQ